MSKCEVILGMNGVAMDRHGLILWENEATGSRKVFRCLLDLWEAIFQLKIAPRTQKSKSPVSIVFSGIFLYIISPPVWGLCWGHFGTCYMLRAGLLVPLLHTGAD